MMVDSNNSFIQEALHERAKDGQLRELRAITNLSGVMVETGGKRMINFSSNDYLGLARHPMLIERSARYLKEFGCGSTASRLVCGNLAIFDDLENELALLKGKEAALLLNSGYQANITYLAALADRHSLIIADRLSHNSLIQGAVLAPCQLLRFRHNDISHLETILKTVAAKRYARTFIVTESVFSMDGDLADLDAISELAERYGVFLIVDEAHATGVFGDNGMGLCCGRSVDLVMGTFGKALGSFGAYIACDQELRQFLINYCAGLIYSTALPPAVLGAISAALELVPTMGKQRQHLMALAEYFRNSLRELGFDSGSSASQIVPLILGSESRTLEAAAWLAERGVLATAIRPPTVEKGRARIRFALSAQHSMEQIDELLDLLKKWREKN